MAATVDWSNLSVAAAFIIGFLVGAIAVIRVLAYVRKHDP